MQKISCYDTDIKMKRFENHHNTCVAEDCWFVIRLDGRNFSKLTENFFEKPFDHNFRKIMTETTKKLFEKFYCHYAFTISDEISLLFPYDYKIFDRKIEKLISLTSATASAAATLISGKHLEFDSRIVTLPNEKCCVDYFVWRQNKGFHNSLNDFTYWTLINNGSSKETAHKETNNKNYSDKINLCFQQNKNFFETPIYFRRGTGFVVEEYQKESFNPKDNNKVLVQRKKIFQNDKLPCQQNYADVLYKIIKQYNS